MKIKEISKEEFYTNSIVDRLLGKEYDFYKNYRTGEIGYIYLETDGNEIDAIFGIINDYWLVSNLVVYIVELDIEIKNTIKLENKVLYENYFE